MTIRFVPLAGTLLAIAPASNPAATPARAQSKKAKPQAAAAPAPQRMDEEYTRLRRFGARGGEAEKCVQRYETVQTLAALGVATDPSFVAEERMNSFHMNCWGFGGISGSRCGTMSSLEPGPGTSVSDVLVRLYSLYSLYNAVEAPIHAVSTRSVRRGVRR